MYSTTLEELVELMSNTIQYKDIDVLKHGYMVIDAYEALIIELESGNHVMSEFYFTLKDKLLDNTDLEALHRYQIFHDCGKPFCKTEEGRFPDHEIHSYNQWNLLFPEDRTVSELIRLDMAFHTYRNEQLTELWNHPLAPSLYFTAWAEIEANASMFGGRDSESYKIKKKRLVKASKKLPPSA